MCKFVIHRDDIRLSSLALTRLRPVNQSNRTVVHRESDLNQDIPERNLASNRVPLDNFLLSQRGSEFTGQTSKIP